MRVPGWVFALLLVGACDKSSGAPAQEPATTGSPAPPRLISAAHIEDVKHCEAVGSSKMGSVTYRMVVGTSGRVQSVRAAQSPVSAAVINCSVQRARAWRFAAGNERTELSFSVPYDATSPTPRPTSKNAKLGKQRTSAIQPCYNEALRTDATIQGALRFAIVIEVSGHVSSVEVDPDASIPPALVACSVEKVRRWVFPMNGADVGADVSFTVVLSPDNANASPAN